LRLDIAYDGADFHGWAHQRDLRTVQGEMETVLGHVFGQSVSLTCAGRTDAGVHARGQVAHFDLPEYDNAIDVWRINRALPDDIRVTAIRQVTPDFDARFSAIWRRYSYTVSDDPRGPAPLDRRRILYATRPLDVEAMNEAAQPLIGEHDFTSFCKLKEHGSTIRRIIDLHWEREGMNAGTTAVMHVKADAFCHSMVRSLAGALIAVGEGRKPIDFPSEALKMKAREAGVTVMPPHPLVLEEVGYPPEDDWASRQATTRVVRSL